MFALRRWLKSQLTLALALVASVVVWLPLVVASQTPAMAAATPVPDQRSELLISADMAADGQIRHQQPIDDHVDGCVLELVVLDEHLTRHADDEVIFIDAVRRHAKAGVADELAEQEQTIRRLDDFAQRLRADTAEIGTDELRMSSRKHPAAEKR